MHAQIEKTKENKHLSVADSVVQTKRNKRQGLEFVDNRSDFITQRKMHETENGFSTSKQTPFTQLKESGVMPIQRKKKGKFSTIAASPAAASVTNMFINQHIGDHSQAIKIAQNRAGSGIAASHTIDLTETTRLLNEMQQRITTDYYIEANQVQSPHAGGMQYLSENTYKIWETKFDNKGRLKQTKEINKRFYYDVLGIAGNALHHFDGPA